MLPWRHFTTSRDSTWTRLYFQDVLFSDSSGFCSILLLFACFGKGRLFVNANVYLYFTRPVVISISPFPRNLVNYSSFRWEHVYLVMRLVSLWSELCVIILLQPVRMSDCGEYYSWRSESTVCSCRMYRPEVGIHWAYISQLGLLAWFK